MIEIGVQPEASQLHRARRSLRAQLDRQRLEGDHAAAVEAVAGELLGAAFDARVTGPVHLRVETFALLTSVRVRCSRNVDLRDEPFGIREKVIEGFAFAWGKRTHSDGAVDLWAEVARPGR